MTQFVDTVLVGQCSSCKEKVVLHWVLGEGEKLLTCCLICDTPVQKTTSYLVTELEEIGFTHDNQEFLGKHGGSGCKGGACGVSQPTD